MLFIYDGWNLIATLRSQVSGLSPQQSYLWGLDLSGTVQGAGGVGGLLAVTDHTTGSTFYPEFDGNGNAMGYYAAETGERVAEFEYGPFGESIRATGSKVDEFNFRFSTKYEDAETGLLYYGFRYYDPGTGRWLSRDPIGENGGLNLYGMVGNNPVNYIDYLGLRELTINIYHNFPDGVINDSVKAEFERIFNDCFKRCKCDSNSVRAAKGVISLPLGLQKGSFHYLCG